MLFCRNYSMNHFQVGTLTDQDSYIGLDDIMIKPRCFNPSNQLPSTVAPTLAPGMTTTTSGPFVGNSYRCSNGLLIPLSKVCDYKKDCSGGEDEKNCGYCAFHNHDMCGYTIENCK